MALLALAAALVEVGWPFYVGLAAGAGQLAWQATTLDMEAPGDCLAKFKSNRWFGAVLFLAIIAGQLSH